MSPNILWLMTDEQRTDSLGGYGSDWAHSPNLDRLCQDGVVFENACTPTPDCQPARFTDSTAVAYPQCGRAALSMLVSVDKGISWTEGLSQAYQCGHCGTRFGLRS